MLKNQISSSDFILTYIPHPKVAVLGNIRYAWCMSTKQSFETKRIDHLGIVAGICQEIGLISAIDQAVGPSERKVSCGEAVQAMVLNGLGFTSRALYLMPQYLDNKPVDLLIAPDLEAEDFNDDTLVSWLLNSSI